MCAFGAQSVSSRDESSCEPDCPAGGQTRFRTRQEALPNLVRLGTGAGAVVFLSAQQATRARAYGDFTRFHDLLYAHLNLIEAERLRTDLMRELEEQFEIQRRRSEDLQSVEDKLRAQLKEVEARLEEILRSPPWELDEGPTRATSDSRIRSFVADLANESGNRSMLHGNARWH